MFEEFILRIRQLMCRHDYVVRNELKELQSDTQLRGTTISVCLKHLGDYLKCNKCGKEREIDNAD